MAVDQQMDRLINHLDRLPLLGRCSVINVLAERSGKAAFEVIAPPKRIHNIPALDAGEAVAGSGVVDIALADGILLRLPRLDGLADCFASPFAIDFG